MDRTLSLGPAAAGASQSSSFILLSSWSLKTCTNEQKVVFLRCTPLQYRQTDRETGRHTNRQAELICLPHCFQRTLSMMWVCGRLLKSSLSSSYSVSVGLGLDKDLAGCRTDSPNCAVFYFLQALIDPYCRRVKGERHYDSKSCIMISERHSVSSSVLPVVNISYLVFIFSVSVYSHI